MKNFENGTEHVWNKEQFLDRYYRMKEMYDNFEDEGEDGEWDLPDVKNIILIL